MNEWINRDEYKASLLNLMPHCTNTFLKHVMNAIIYVYFFIGLDAVFENEAIFDDDGVTIKRVI